MKEEKQQSGEKIGEYIKNAMRELFYQDMLPAEVVKQLESKDFCRETFRIDSPVLVDEKTLTADKGGNSQYSEEPLFGNFFIYNEWSETARALFDSWLDSVIARADVAAAKEEDSVNAVLLVVYVGYSWPKDVSVFRDPYWISLRDFLTSITSKVEKRDEFKNKIKIGVNRLRASHSAFVHEDIVRRIDSAAVLVFDLAQNPPLDDDSLKEVVDEDGNITYSSFNSNVLYEVGVAIGKGKKPVIMCPKSLFAKRPSDLNGYLFTTYETSLKPENKCPPNSKRKHIDRIFDDSAGLRAMLTGALVAEARRVLENLKK